jgi:hypothetical protein
VDDINPEGHIQHPFDPPAWADLVRDGRTGEFATSAELQVEAERRAHVDMADDLARRAQDATT